MFAQLSGPQVDSPTRCVQEPGGGVELVRRDRDLRLRKFEHGPDLGLCLRLGGVFCECLTLVLILRLGGFLVDPSDGLFG